MGTGMYYYLLPNLYSSQLIWLEQDYSPDFTLHGHQPVLLFEYTFCSLVDITVASVYNCIKAIFEVIALVHSSMAHSAVSIANTVKHHH